METVRLSSKGQFVLPKAIRELHRWGPGTELAIVDRGTEVVLMPATPFEPTRFEAPDTPSVYKGRRLSVAEMDRAVAFEAGKRR